MAERPLYTLYKNLKAQNYDVPDDYNKFESALTRDGKGGADNRHAIYENLKAQNFDVPNTYERFYSALFEPRSKTSSRAKGGSVPMTAADRARFSAGAAAISASANNAVRQAKRNIQSKLGQAKKFNGGRVSPRLKNPLQNQNVQKNEFNYNSTTGKNGTYTTTDGVEFDNEYDATQYQNKLDKYGEEWSKAVGMGIVPSELDKADPDLSDTDVAMRQMERRQEWLNENQDRRSKELNESMHLQGSPFVASGGAVAPSSFNTAISNEANRLSDVEYGAYNTAKAYNQMLRTTLLQELKEQKQINENAGWLKDKWNDVFNYFGAMFNTMLDPKLYSQGVMDAAIANNLLQVKKGMEDGTIKKGSNAGNAAQAMLGAIQQQQGEAAKQQQYGTKAYLYGDMSGRSLKFMGDFALSGWRNVMTTGFTKAGEKVGEKMALGALGKWFTKNTGRVLGDMAGSAALAATNQLGSTYNNVIERYVGMNNENGGVTQDKNGDLKFNEGVSLGKAIKDGFGSATIENFSEMFGEYLPGAPKLLSKLGLSKVSAFFEKIGNNAYYKWLSNATNKTGIQGVMAEISEEEFGTALHAAWGDGDGSWSDFNVFTNPDAREKQIDTCLGMFYSVGFMQAPRTAVGAINAVQYFNIKHQVAKADKFGQVMFNDKWDEVKSKIDVTTNADLTKTVLDATRSDSMTAKQKGAVINYAMFLSKLRGFNQASDAKTKDKVEEGDTAPTLSNDLDDAYTEGHNADDADKHNIQLEQNDKANELAAMLHITPEQLHDMADEDLETMTGQDDKLDKAIYDYQVSTAKYQGVMDGAQDEVDMAAHQAAMETDNMTDLSRGTVRKATIKATGGLEDYEVYIISGNIATHDDGSIDVGNSDDMIIYYDPTTGRKEHADAMMFADLIEELPAADVKAQAVADAKENAIKKIAGIVDGTIDVGSQFSVTDADGLEHTYEVLADNGDGTAMITIDGNVPTELVNGENVQIPYSFADLQQLKDAEDLKRLKAAKTEREQMEKERAEQTQETEQTEEIQPSFDFNQILNDNGNVVLADVLGKDGNTKYPNSQLFLIRDSGAKAKVMELKSDGTLVPHAVNKKDVRTATTMTLDEYKQAFADSSMIEENSGAIEGDRGGIEVNDELPPVPDNVTINGDGTYSVDGAVQGGENTTAPAEQTEQTPAMTLEDGTIVPMLEDGNPDFSKLTADQTAELYDTQFGDDADSVISGWVSDAKKALDKANNMTVKGKNFVEQKAAKEAKEKAIADAQTAYDSAIAIRDAYNSRQLAKVEDTAEGRKNLIEKARRKFSRLKSAVKDDAEAVSQLYKDVVGSLLHRLYDGTGIDVTDTIPLTAEEYVASNLGAHSLNYEGTETSKGVKQETGLSREDFAKTQLLAADGKGTTIDDLVHSLWENRPSNLDSLDTQDIRNALIGVLTSGFKASEARNYIENLRIAQAENILEEQKKAAENAAFAEENKSESEQQTETAPESEEKTGEDNSDEINDEENEQTNEQTNAPEQNNFPDKLREGSKAIEVPEDATDEKPLGEQRTKSPFLVRENGKQQTETESDADVEKNKVDDMKVVDNIVGEKTRKTLEKIAKIMGANVQWLYSNEQFNGKFDEKTNTIYLTLDSSITEGVQFIFGHEMTHEMRTKNPAAYGELKTLVKDMMGEDAFNSETDKIQIRYKKGGARYWNNRNAIEEEVVADQLGKWIRDANYAHTLLLKMSHPLLAKLHEIVNSFLMALHGTEFSDDMRLILRSIEQAYVKTAKGEVTNSETGEDVSFSLRLKSAIEETETNPSDAQKESGNYKKGHIKFGGYDYTIENPKGSTRSGKDANGKEWKVTMHDTYGYIRGKFGKDGDHLDMFINDKADLDNWDGDVFVVDQVNPDGSFDEHKVMYGYDSMDDAKKAYLANYSDGWQGLGNITGASKDEFDKWLDTSNRKLKPFADYAKVKFSLKDIKPIGVGAFGNIYNQFRGNAKAAIEFLKKVRGGEAVGALHHKDIGDIDLVWGKEGTGHSDGYGLSKLVKYHPEVLDNLQEILNDMRVVSSSKNRVNLESETHKAGVRLTWDGERKSWLLTAFKKETSASDKRTDTAATSLEGDTALSQTEGSAAKIDNSSETAKENEEKFSLKDEKTMFGMHNISIDKLRKAIKQGGFAAPSMGVVDSKNGIYSDYGEITLIPKAEKLAKRTGKNAGTFTADAWTPTYPQVERIMNKQGEKAFNTDMNEKLGDVDNGIYSNIRESWKGYFSSGDVRDGLYWHYLFDKGMTPETIYQTGKYDNDITNEVMRISDNGSKTDYTDEEVAELIQLKNKATGEDNDVEAMREKLKARIASAEKKGNHLLAALKKKRLAELEGVENFYIAADFVNDVVRNSRKNGKVNVYETMSAAKEKVENDKKLSADFPSWLDKKTEEYGVEEMLYNGTTPSGKPKYIPNTIDNAVKLMKKQGVAGGYTAFGSELGVFIAKNSPEVNTLAAMKNAKDKLIPFGDERHNQIKDKITKEFLELSDEIRVGSNDRYAFDDSGVSRMVELTDHKGNEKEYLKKAYNVEVSDEWMDRYNKLLDTIKKDYKVFYFETKFMRPYGLDEFEKAIVPSDTPSDVVDALKKAGIDVSSYERGNAEDRQKVTMNAINSSDNIRFSLKAEKEKIVADAKANGTYMTAPNGEKTKLDAEQWATVRTANFKNWFGDWENDPENASKVVDENGEPMVVWHGRSAEFNTFEKKEGVRFIMGLEDKVKSEGFFFSPDKGLAEEFASNSSRHRGGKANVVPCFLNIRKPMDLTGEDYDRIYEDVTGWEYMVGMDTQDNLWGIMDEEGMADKIKKKGYDGAIFVEEVDDSYEPTKISYCALDANQIKSAENNNGDFSADNNDIRFSLAGERGAAAADKADERTFRMDNLSVARKMEEEKKDAKAIKIATGWERGADGKWRYEMPDAKIKDTMDVGGGHIVKRYEDDMLWNGGKLSDVIDAPELFKAYPHLKDVRIETDAIMNDMPSNGEYNAKTNTITIHADELKYMNSILNHEIQHAIQSIEGFDRGGSPRLVRGEIKKRLADVTKKIRQLRAEGKEDEAKAIVEKNRGLYIAYQANDDYNSYKSLAGEVEARNVQERMNMSPKERRRTLAESTEDVARKDQIFLGVGDVSFSLRDMADGKESGAADMAEDLKSLNTPGEVDDAINTAIDDMPSGWQMANKKMIHIAQALGENRKAEIAGVEPKFSLKDGSLIKAGTYFSGGGLVEEGLKGIIDPVVAVEYDEKISGVYRNNFGQHIVTADVRDVDPKELVKQIDGEVEYFHASPVCKNYSQAKSNHTEVELDKETAASTAEFINAVKPKVVTIENVKGYKDSDAMKIITDALDANGYTWDADVYNAADYGGYTNRERLIVRAVRDGKLPEKPKKMAHKSGWYEAVADIIPTLTEKKNGVANWMDIRLKADGIDWRNIDKPLYVMGSAYADGKIPHAFADELLPTLRTKSGDVIVMPDGKVYRAMGRVLARVSGVSDDYKMPFSENLSHTIIGNGIPTQLTEHVIAPLLQNTLHPTTPEDGNTKFSLRYDKFEHDLNQWKKDNNLPKDAQRPTIPQRNAGESAVDFLRRVDEYRKQMALWKTAPTYEQHLLSDDTALGEFNRELQKGSVLKRIAFQDSMLAIRKAQEAIMKEVGVDRLNMAEDAYTAENRSHGKGKNEFEEYNNEFLQPLRKAYHQMKKVLGDSYDNVRVYMMAKHGLERDAQMAFKKSLEADYEDVNQRSAAYKAYKNDLDRVSNDADLEFGRVDFTTWRQKDNALRGKYSPSYMDYRYDDNGIAYDYSGLSSLFDGSDFEEAAHRLVRDVETKHLAEVQALWNATNAATKKILRDGFKAGMMSKYAYEYVKGMYSHYIPLRGWDGTTADQVWDYIGGGKGAFNQTLKTAHGRTSIADDPIAYIENMAESGILLNNKNWVKHHLMLLAQNHPTSLLTLSKAWYVKSTDANGNEEWIPATPQITSQMNSNQVKAAIDAFEQKMEQLAQTGDATQQRDGLNIAYPQTHSEEREHEVRVMKDGEEYVIYVNGDPQLAQAMNNTRAHRVREIQSGKLDRAAAWLGRKMAAAYTSLSPLFIPSNYFRDLTMTLASTAIREDGRYNYLLRKNLATSWNLGFMLKDYQNGKLRDKVNNGNATPKEQMFYDFMMNGGETGFVSSLEVEDLKKKFKNDLKDLDRWKANPVKVGHTIMDSIEFLNRTIEDSNRFAVYMTSIQYGRSIDEAVDDAKDVTLNFNRKGTGEYGWQMIRNLYLFINPAVQSLQTLGALVKHHPFKFTAVTASWLASGVLVPIVNAALMSLLGGDDDKDKYWKFSKWDRRNNLIMWIPYTHEYVKIPLAQEFRAFYGVGDMIASKMMGEELAEESWEEYAEDLMGQVVDMLPLDPTGYDGNIAVSLMPNPIRPVFELAFNVDFTGKPLFKETEYNKYDPNFTKAYVGTPDWLVRVSKMVNSIGNDYPDVQQNAIDAFGDPRYNLNNPAVVDHVLSSYLGGAYTMGSQVLGVLTKLLNDPKEIKMADIPLVSKFVSNPDDRPVTKKQGDEFWNMKENHDRAANTLSKLKKQAKVDGDYSMLERFYGSEEYKQYKQEDVKVKKYEEDKKKERAEESGEEYRPHKLNAEDIYKAHATPKDDFEDLKLKQLYTKLNGFKTSYDLLLDTAPSQSDGYYNTNKAAIDAIDEISLDKQEISELKKGFLEDGKDAYNAEDMKRIRELRKRILSVLEPANKVVVANQKAKAEK